MRILIAADHGGVKLKKEIINFFEQRGDQVTNLGTDTEDSVDYTDYAEKAVAEFQKQGYDLGILVCGTGIGMCITANKFPGIRCAMVHDQYTAQMAKSHNQANFLALGGRITYHEPVPRILTAFLDTAHSVNGRHDRRLNKLADLEKNIK